MQIFSVFWLQWQIHIFTYSLHLCLYPEHVSSVVFCSLWRLIIVIILFGLIVAWMQIFGVFWFQWHSYIFICLHLYSKHVSSMVYCSSCRLIIAVILFDLFVAVEPQAAGWVCRPAAAAWRAPRTAVWWVSVPVSSLPPALSIFSLFFL